MTTKSIAARRARLAARWVLAAMLVASLAACGRSSSAHDPLLVQSVPAHRIVDLNRIGPFGEVLTDSDGHALYMFPPDAGSHVTCTGPCAGTWPPLTISANAQPSAGVGVNAQLLGTLPDPNSGARIITYGGYPLYHYAGDLSAGSANGQDLFVDGGPWYVLTADAQPVTTNPGGGQ